MTSWPVRTKARYPTRSIGAACLLWLGALLATADVAATSYYVSTSDGAAGCNGTSPVAHNPGGNPANCPFASGVQARNALNNLAPGDTIHWRRGERFTLADQNRYTLGFRNIGSGVNGNPITMRDYCTADVECGNGQACRDNAGGTCDITNGTNEPCTCANGVAADDLKKPVIRGAIEATSWTAASFAGNLDADLYYLNTNTNPPCVGAEKPLRSCHPPSGESIGGTQQWPMFWEQGSCALSGTCSISGDACALDSDCPPGATCDGAATCEIDEQCGAFSVSGIGRCSRRLNYGGKCASVAPGACSNNGNNKCSWAGDCGSGGKGSCSHNSSVKCYTDEQCDHGDDGSINSSSTCVGAATCDPDDEPIGTYSIRPGAVGCSSDGFCNSKQALGSIDKGYCADDHSLVCDNNTDCRVCESGARGGLQCETNADCPASACRAGNDPAGLGPCVYECEMDLETLASFGHPLKQGEWVWGPFDDPSWGNCWGGPNDGSPCDFDTDCPSGNCSAEGGRVYVKVPPGAGPPDDILVPDALSFHRFGGGSASFTYWTYKNLRVEAFNGKAFDYTSGQPSDNVEGYAFSNMHIGNVGSSAIQIQADAPSVALGRAIAGSVNSSIEDSTIYCTGSDGIIIKGWPLSDGNTCGAGDGFASCEDNDDCPTTTCTCSPPNGSHPAASGYCGPWFGTGISIQRNRITGADGDGMQLFFWDGLADGSCNGNPARACREDADCIDLSPSTCTNNNPVRDKIWNNVSGFNGIETVAQGTGGGSGINFDGEVGQCAGVEGMDIGGNFVAQNGFHGILLEFCTRTSALHHNVAFANGSAGGAMSGMQTTNGGTSNAVYFNAVINPTTGSANGSPSCFYTAKENARTGDAATDNFVFHNTCIKDGVDGAKNVLSRAMALGDTTRSRMNNNLMYSLNSTFRFNNMFDILSNNGSGDEIDYNAFRNGAAHQWRSGTNTYGSLTAWTAGEGFDAHSDVFDDITFHCAPNCGDPDASGGLEYAPATCDPDSGSPIACAADSCPGGDCSSAVIFAPKVGLLSVDLGTIGGALSSLALDVYEHGDLCDWHGRAGASVPGLCQTLAGTSAADFGSLSHVTRGAFEIQTSGEVDPDGMPTVQGVSRTDVKTAP